MHLDSRMFRFILENKCTLSDLKGEFSLHKDLFVNTLQCKMKDSLLEIRDVSLISHPLVYPHSAVV